MNRVIYNTNAGGYYFVTLRTETGDLCWGFEEYNHHAGDSFYPEMYSSKSDYHKAVAEQIRKFKYMTPDFYNSICKMLQSNNRNIEDYEYETSNK